MPHGHISWIYQACDNKLKLRAGLQMLGSFCLPPPCSYVPIYPPSSSPVFMPYLALETTTTGQSNKGKHGRAKFGQCVPAKDLSKMESDEDCVSDFVKEEVESFDDNDSHSNLCFGQRIPGVPVQTRNLPTKTGTTVHYHPVTSSMSSTHDHDASTQFTSPPASTIFQGGQRPILPRLAAVERALACDNEKRHGQAGDYLDFVIWIRSLLLRMHPSLSMLPEDMPLFGGLKWPDRHSWGRKVDEECPSHWRVQIRFYPKQGCWKQLGLMFSQHEGCFYRKVNISNTGLIQHGTMPRGIDFREEIHCYP